MCRERRVMVLKHYLYKTGRASRGRVSWIRCKVFDSYIPGVRVVLPRDEGLDATTPADLIHITKHRSDTHRLPALPPSQALDFREQIEDGP